MEIITLLRANIRHKKGSFLSVILLTLIVSMAVTTTLSIKESADKGVENSHEMSDTPDLFVQYFACRLTDKMIDDVKNSPMVKNVRIGDCLFTDKVIMNKNLYTNSSIITRTPDNAKLLNNDINSIRKDIPKLKKGEIYVSQGLLTNVDGKVGQKITIETLAGDYTFTVKGILLDSMSGASVIGWKKYCISDEDYVEMEAAFKKNETKKAHAVGKILEIYKTDDCGLSDAKFRRQLNLDTDILNMDVGSITKDMSVYYTTLFPVIISSCLMVFIMLLLVIVLIVTAHSISMEIESNYLTFGILKTQGFGKNKLRALFLLQYLIAEILGSLFGIIFSIPIIRKEANIFAPITGIPAVVSVPVHIILLILLSLFILSVISIMFVTVKLNNISPVRAISGAKKEIYFESMVNFSISKKLISASLALRQFTFAKRKYIGMFIIVSGLVFFMMTINVLSNALNSKTAVESMGAIVSEVNVGPKKRLSDKEYGDIEKEIGKYTKIKKAYYFTSDYFSFNGEEIMCQTFKNPDILPVLKGRAPIYDNEIAVSPTLLDEYNLKIGDEVTIAWEDKKEKYIISGTVQLMNDAGRCFEMSYAGAEKLGFDFYLWANYSLENDKDKKAIAKAINKKFGDIVEARETDGILDDMFQIAVDSMQLIIYVFSIIFSLVVVHMVCLKAFIGERRDIGIYKALGFTSVKLRLQFAVRFFIVAVLGSFIGGTLSYAFSGKLLGVLLRGIGITSFVTEFDILTFIIPIAIVCVSFFGFSFFTSGKVRRVEIKELVTE